MITTMTLFRHSAWQVSISQWEIERQPYEGASWSAFMKGGGVLPQIRRPVLLQAPCRTLIQPSSNTCPIPCPPTLSLAQPPVQLLTGGVIQKLHETNPMDIRSDSICPHSRQRCLGHIYFDVASASVYACRALSVFWKQDASQTAPGFL